MASDRAEYVDPSRLKVAVERFPSAQLRLRAEYGSGNQSDQHVPIAPDPGADDAGQIPEIRKHHIGLGRFEAKLDPSGHRYETFFERGRERALVEMSEPEGDCRSGQSHDRT